MRCPRKRNAVTYYVRTARLDGPDVRRVHFGPAAAVNEFQTTNRTALIVGAQYYSSEHAISHDPRYSKAYALALLIELKRRLFFLKSRSNRHVANAWQQRRAIF